jgi:hypothetical protein
MVNHIAHETAHGLWASRPGYPRQRGEMDADLRSLLPRRPEIAASVFPNVNATGRMSDGHDAGDTAALYRANDGVLSDEAVAEELGLISWLIERRPNDAE